MKLYNLNTAIEYENKGYPIILKQKGKYEKMNESTIPLYENYLIEDLEKYLNKNEKILLKETIYNKSSYSTLNYLDIISESYISDLYIKSGLLNVEYRTTNYIYDYLEGINNNDISEKEFIMLMINPLYEKHKIEVELMNHKMKWITIYMSKLNVTVCISNKNYYAAIEKVKKIQEN